MMSQAGASVATYAAPVSQTYAPVMSQTCGASVADACGTSVAGAVRRQSMQALCGTDVWRHVCGADGLERYAAQVSRTPCGASVAGGASVAACGASVSQALCGADVVVRTRRLTCGMMSGQQCGASVAGEIAAVVADVRHLMSRTAAQCLERMRRQCPGQPVRCQWSRAAKHDV
jgi:hypothetical protein